MGNNNTYYSLRESIVLIPNILTFLWFLSQVFTGKNWKETVFFVVMTIVFGLSSGILFDEFEKKREMKEKIYKLTKGN